MRLDSFVGFPIISGSGWFGSVESFAAMVQQLRKDLPVIELGAPEFCVFEDMYAFRKVFAMQ